MPPSNRRRPSNDRRRLRAWSLRTRNVTQQGSSVSRWSCGGLFLDKKQRNVRGIQPFEHGKDRTAVVPELPPRIQARDIEGQPGFIRTDHDRTTIESSHESPGQDQFGDVPVSRVRIFNVPCRTHSACSADGPVPLGVLMCILSNSYAISARRPVRLS